MARKKARKKRTTRTPKRKATQFHITGDNTAGYAAGILIPTTCSLHLKITYEPGSPTHGPFLTFECECEEVSIALGTEEGLDNFTNALQQLWAVQELAPAAQEAADAVYADAFD